MNTTASTSKVDKPSEMAKKVGEWISSANWRKVPVGEIVGVAGTPYLTAIKADGDKYDVPGTTMGGMGRSRHFACGIFSRRLISVLPRRGLV